MILNKILGSILINMLIIYFVAKYIPSLGLEIDPLTSLPLEVLLIIGAIFWFLDEIVKGILKIVVLPFYLLFGGLITLLLNFGMFYLFAFIINNYLDLEVTIKLGTIIQVFILSFVVSLTNLLLKKL